MPLQIEYWPIGRLKPYEKNPRKNDQAVARMVASIQEFGFAVPILARSSGEVVDGHLRLKAALKLGLTELPVICCDSWTEAQVKAFRIMVNRSVTWAEWDKSLLTMEFQELKGMNFDLALTGFEPGELERFMPGAAATEDEVPPVPIAPVSRPGDLWLCGNHRVLCGDATSRDDVNRLLEARAPILMVTDPPYGVSLDSEWRDRAGLNGCGPAEASYLKKRTAGHTETTISGDTRADWSEAFELVVSLLVAYVWHASAYTLEVLQGLIRIDFLYPQQIIWNKNVAALTRTHYWYKHEPCWYVRKKNAPWFGKPGENLTVWDAISPKMIMGGSKEEKYDHPTQKPVELMRKSIINHTVAGDLVYDPFLGSGTTLAAAEVTGRRCLGLEIDPKYVDVVVERWQKLSGKEATLEGVGATFAHVRDGRRLGEQDAIKEEILK